MQPEEIKAVFDQQASSYDEQWARMSPIRECLYFLLDAVFVDLPTDARILCVGAGTGAELAYLARRFPMWRFTAVDASGAMLDKCRERAEAEGYLSRCSFHEGYVESLPADEVHDGATCFLVSQFILPEEARTDFFRAIAVRLRPGGILASSDLAFDVGSRDYDAVLRAWLITMVSAGVQPDVLEKTRAAYANDVAILRPERVASMIESAGFESSIQFFQGGLIHAWFSKRA